MYWTTTRANCRAVEFDGGQNCMLLPTFDEWLSGGKASGKIPNAAAGTLDWLFAEYRADRRFTMLDNGT